MRNFKWENGRQNSGYLKMKIFESKLFKADCYILKYPKSSKIDPHTDEVEGHEHHRVNIILKKAKLGGGFYTKRKFQSQNRYYKRGRFNYFRPDKTIHGVGFMHLGTRYVLSIGWLKKK